MNKKKGLERWYGGYGMVVECGQLTARGMAWKSGGGITNSPVENEALEEETVIKSVF